MKWLQFDGGPEVARIWALNQGLGFAWKELYGDEEIKKSWSQWIDLEILEEQGKWELLPKIWNAPWYEEWFTYSTAQVSETLTGAASVADTCKAMQNKWIELRKEYS